MKALRVTIEGWTASFRHPGFISGYQPTLPSPPLSTIFGLISAAKGEPVTPEDITVGYVFTSESTGVDLETIYELSPNLKAKSNVVKREFLLNPVLHLYLNDVSYEKYFKKPAYPLLLGRSSDLAVVTSIEEVDLAQRKNVQLGNTILPLEVSSAQGVVKALPTHFTDSIPRRARGTRPFILSDTLFTYPGECLYDEEKGWGVWLHENR